MVNLLESGSIIVFIVKIVVDFIYFQKQKKSKNLITTLKNHQF